MTSVNALSSPTFLPMQPMSTRSTLGGKVGTAPTTTSPPPSTSPPVGGRQLTAPNLAKAAHLKAAGAAAKAQQSQPSEQPSPTSSMYGDVNGDGVFNNDDASALLGYLFGGEAPEGVANADANGDGNVDISDAVQLLNILRGQGPYTADTTSGADKNAAASSMMAKNTVAPSGHDNGGLPTFVTSR